MTGIIVALNYHRAKKLVYVSMVGLIRESSFHDISVNILATITINLLIFSIVTESSSLYENIVYETASN